MGPEPVSTVLSAEQEAGAGTFRQHPLLALDDCLYALQATIPHLSRSALHRCFQCHGISRLRKALRTEESPHSTTLDKLRQFKLELPMVNAFPTFGCALIALQGGDHFGPLEVSPSRDFVEGEYSLTFVLVYGLRAD